MQKSEFIKIIKRVEVAPYSNFEELNSLAKQYPYSSTLHVIKALAAKEEDRIEQNSSLEIAAVYIQDRSKLYDYTVRKSIDHKIKEFSDSADEDKINKKAQESEKIDDPNLKIENLDIASSKDQTEENSKNPISRQPLEEQIMHEAVMHLGELEAERSLSELPEEQPGLGNQDAEPEKLSTSKDKPESFGSWLLNIDKNKGETTAEIDRSLIDKFIQESPQISPVKAAFFSPSQVGKMSLMEDETFVTETLANIYEKQGDYKKAARAYKNLMLKYPEKSSYFAALQKKAEDQIKK